MATHTTLNSLFTDIADEIRAKKGTSETIVADNFPTEIANLPSGGDPSEYFNTNPTAEELATPDGWVRDKMTTKYPELTIPDGITNLSYLCQGITTPLKVTFGNSVTKIDRMFYESKITAIDFSGFNLEKVTSTSYLFSANRELVSIDLSNLEFPGYKSQNVCDNWFYSCSKLEKAIIPKNNLTSYAANPRLYNTFYNCYLLKTLIIPYSEKMLTYSSTFTNCHHMNGTVNATYNPQGLKDGRIYVPDNLVNDYKSASGWSTYADQILPLSQYVEE